VNGTSRISMATSEHYAAPRRAPASNVVVRNDTTSDPTLGLNGHETISSNQFDDPIRIPLTPVLVSRSRCRR